MAAGAQVPTRRTCHFRLRLGGICLYDHPFQALELEAVFDQANGASPPLRLDGVPPEIDGVRCTYRYNGEAGQSVARAPGWIRYVRRRYRRFYVEVSGSFADYLRRHNTKSRNTQGRKVRHFMRLSGREDCLREFKEPGEMEEFHRLACEVSRRSYQGRVLRAGIPETAGYRDELVSQARQEGVRGYILMYGDMPAAYGLCRKRGGVLTYEKTGFDPALAPLHPGSVLLYLLLERTFRCGDIRIFDFGPGEFEYKARMATGSVPCMDVYLFRRNLSNLLLTLTDFITSRTWGVIQRVLELLGIRAKLRGLIYRNL